MRIERDKFTHRPRSKARYQILGAQLAKNAIAPGPVGQAKRGQLPASLFDQQRTFPVAPAAGADDPGPHILLGPRQSGQNAALWRGVIELEVEFIAIRCGIQQRKQAVAPAQSAIGADQSPAGPDIDPGDQIDASLFACNALVDRQPIKFEPVNPKVEFRKDRRIRIARIEFGSAQQQPPPSHQLADV